SYDTFFGSNATSTASACPVRPVHTSSYVGFGVNPPAYPTAVVYTPGICQKSRSAPQKQPSANTAVSIPSWNGAINGVPSTSCRSGTSNARSSRPGNASSGETIFTSRLNSCMGNTSDISTIPLRSSDHPRTVISSYLVPRPSFPGLRTSYFVPRTSYLAFVPLDLHHRTKPIVVVPVVGRDAAAGGAAADLHGVPPGAAPRCLPLRQVRQRHAALRRPLRVDVGRNRIVPRVVPVGAPLMDVESDVDQPVTVRRRSPDLPWRVLREPPSVPVERLVAPRILRPIDASERCLLPLRLRRQPEPLAM